MSSAGYDALIVTSRLLKATKSITPTLEDRSSNQNQLNLPDDVETRFSPTIRLLLMAIQN
jgi:hypothetical protein